MTITRRSFLNAAAVAGATAALPSRLLATVTPPAAPGVAAVTPPRVFATVAPTQPSINPALKARALASLQSKGNLIRYRDVIGIADFNRLSREPRFYLLDLRSGFVTQHHVAHGRGSDPDHLGWLERFSNEFGSEATSDGAYLTGESYTGKYGWSLRLFGLDPSNSNAHARSIVVHSAWYAEPKVALERGKLGRSEGCFALPGISHAETATRLRSGRFLYAEKI